MRIVSYNIKHGGLKREEAILRSLIVAKPDVIILQEAIYPHVVVWLAEQLDFPYFDCIRGSSVAFLSKIPPINYRWHQRPMIKTPFLQLDITNGLTIYGIHLTAMLSKWSEQKRAYEISQLMQIIAKHAKTHHLLIGDMNTIARGDNVIIGQMPLWLQIVIYISGGIQHIALDILIEEGYVDVFRHLNSDNNGYTIPTPSPNARLDYAFATISLIEHISSCSVMRQPNEVDEASDHYPLILDLEI